MPAHCLLLWADLCSPGHSALGGFEGIRLRVESEWRHTTWVGGAGAGLGLRQELEVGGVGAWGLEV